MLIVGIDPSLSQTAMVIGSSASEFSVTLHKTKCQGDAVADRCRRYEVLVADVMRVLDPLRQAGETIRIFLEGYSFNSKFGGERLGEYGGILRWHLVDCDPLLTEVAPASLKKFVVGKGGAKKEMMLLKCFANWQYEAKGNDDADAFGLFRLGLCACGVDAPQNVAQREVLAKMQGA